MNEMLTGRLKRRGAGNWLVAKRLSVPEDIAKAIQRALNARQMRKDKTVLAPASSRAALLASADAKAFAEALSRRDEALANVRRRQDAAMAKK